MARSFLALAPHMNHAWASWKAATRFLFWALVETITGAIAARKEAQRELTAFSPATPKDLCASGYALFRWEPYGDSWEGFWRDPAERPGLIASVEYRVFDWNGVPWHSVKFSEADWLNATGWRAVPRDYCEKNLKPEQLRWAA